MLMVPATTATTAPATASSTKWFAVAMIEKTTSAGYSAQMPRDPPPPREGDAGGPEDQGVRGVQARHCRVGVCERRDCAGMVVDCGLVERVGEAEARQHPRRGRRVGEIADQPDRVGRDDGVSDRRVPVGVAQVRPQEERERDRELGVEIRPVGDVKHDPGRVEGEPLDRELAEDAERPLGVDDVVRMCQRGAAAPGRDDARELVGDVEQRHDHDLAQEIPGTTREQRAQPGSARSSQSVAECGDHGASFAQRRARGHRGSPCISVRVTPLREGEEGEAFWRACRVRAECRRWGALCCPCQVAYVAAGAARRRSGGRCPSVPHRASERHRRGRS